MVPATGFVLLLGTSCCEQMPLVMTLLQISNTLTLIRPLVGASRMVPPYFLSLMATKMDKAAGLGTPSSVLSPIKIQGAEREKRIMSPEP